MPEWQVYAGWHQTEPSVAMLDSREEQHEHPPVCSDHLCLSCAPKRMQRFTETSKLMLQKMQVISSWSLLKLTSQNNIFTF